ncbi:polyprenyl diphosphate synthase [Candidatus Fonsibacter ubiquis]|uniref:polyprenyl diphosphate synthase n=1 Tax=Candidatus Fonsibacter ubiquis TaxID=1925548 RepID=UPI000C0700BA|nr:polyprenyl diphosphate synthase [Candidatus Fonsibacter ubiquis]
MISPSHIAIIMDGNGRWGLKKYNNRNKGHYYGLLNINKVIEHCIKIKIKYLTLYTFSTENWNRPKKEIDYLFFLFKYFYKKNFNKLNKNNIKIKFIGDLKNIPKDLKIIIKKIEDKTKNNDAITVIFAFNYGAKSELVNAFKNIIKNKTKVNEINEELINNYLYTNNIPDPDILIRTGGEKRLSNFLLWQLSYAELFFINKNWPDFNFFDLKKVIKAFGVTKRKFGGLNE